MIPTSPPADAISASVVIQDLIVGRGTMAQQGDGVVVHYVVKLLGGQEVDSTRERRHPVGFALGMGVVIEGLHQGLRGMRVGGMRKLIIPAELAYGARGCGDTVPPNATLVYDVELLKVT